jgi:hypothetical protein
MKRYQVSPQALNDLEIEILQDPKEQGDFDNQCCPECGAEWGRGCFYLGCDTCDTATYAYLLRKGITFEC